jgi:tetratricopeptide (TPR) repeat protein
MEDINELRKQYHLLKKEVDSLQISIMSAKIPWYKNIPIIVSVIALLFSFGTTYVSNQRIAAQDVQALKTELRSMLQQLSVLPSKNFELKKKYSNDAYAVAFISGQLNQENALLAFQAADLVSRLPSKKVTAIEMYSLALAFQNSYEIQKANEMYQLSYDIAEDMSTAVAAKRGIANSLYQLGQPEAGRVHFQEALNIFSRYKGHNDFIQKNTHIKTLLNWFGSEAGGGYIARSKQKLDEARGIVESLPPGPFTEQVAKQVAQGYNTLAAMESNR